MWFDLFVGCLEILLLLHLFQNHDTVHVPVLFTCTCNFFMKISPHAFDHANAYLPNTLTINSY